MSKTPSHLWIVGGLSLLWNLGGVVDYVMTRYQYEPYLATTGVPIDVMLGWIDSFPLWASAAWALGVWAAFAGSILLLMRKRYAVHAFAASLLGIFIAAAGQHFVVRTPAEMQGVGSVIFSTAIMVIGAALYFYARRMDEKGVLA